MGRKSTGWRRAVTAHGAGGGAGTLTEQVIARLNLLGGWAWDASADSVGTNYQEAARTNLVTTASQRLGSVTDLTNNAKHATAAGTARPTWDGTGCAHADGQFLATASIDTSTTDTLTVISCIVKASDTSIWTDCELGGANNGGEPGVSLRAPAFSTGAGFGFLSRGSGSLASINNTPNFPAPITCVAMGIGRVSTDTCALYIDNVLTNHATTDQGGGNFQNAPFCFGASYDGTYPYFSGKWGRRVVTPYEPSEADKLLYQRWCAEKVSITIPLNYVAVAMGDSHTRVPSGTIAQAWPNLVDLEFPQIVGTVNLGQSGDTTSNMMARRSQMLRAGTPNIGYLSGGQNDPAATTTVWPTPTPTATGCTLTSISGHAVDGWITIGGVQTQILSIVGSAITYPALAGGAPSAGATVAIDTEKNFTEMALYLQAAGCSRVLVIGKHFSNTASGGDTVSVEQPFNAALRVKQRAAATATNSVYVDVYAHGCALINGGTYAQGDALWHVSSADDHLSLAGCTDLMMPPIKAAIQAQGWA